MRISKNKTERRSELIDTAILLFREKGYVNTMVQDIVKAVGVAQGTFYYYFETKEEILVAALEQTLNRTFLVIREQLSDLSDPRSQLKELMRFFFRTPSSDSTLTSLLIAAPESIHAEYDLMRNRIFLPLVTELVEEGIKQQLFFSLPHPGKVVEIVFLGISFSFHQLALDLKELPAEQHETATRETLEAMDVLFVRLLGFSIINDFLNEQAM